MTLSSVPFTQAPEARAEELPATPEVVAPRAPASDRAPGKSLHLGTLLLVTAGAAALGIVGKVLGLSIGMLVPSGVAPFVGAHAGAVLGAAVGATLSLNFLSSGPPASNRKPASLVGGLAGAVDGGVAMVVLGLVLTSSTSPLAAPLVFLPVPVLATIGALIDLRVANATRLAAAFLPSEHGARPW